MSNEKSMNQLMAEIQKYRQLIQDNENYPGVNQNEVRNWKQILHGLECEYKNRMERRNS